MTAKTNATLTSKGQITIPADIREKWNLKAGDKISFENLTPEKGTIRPERRRSIFDRLDKLQQPKLGRPLTQKALDDAIGEAVREKLAKPNAKKAR